MYNNSLEGCQISIQEKITDIFCMFCRDLEQDLEHCRAKLESTEVALRQKEEDVLKHEHEMQASKEALSEVERKLKEELKASQKTVSDLETQLKFINQQIQDSQATVGQQEAELGLLREVLQRTESKMLEDVAHLEQKCLLSAEEKRMHAHPPISIINNQNKIQQSVVVVAFRNSRGGLQETGGVDHRGQTA